ncbi:MAG: DNA replication/repair protein RecF, partial [Inquilinaceae bacterium]
HLTAPGGPIAVGTGIDPGALPAATRRVVRIDGRSAASQVELGAVAAMAWLTPQMDRLFLEGAGNRRRFLDRLVYGFYPDHARHLSAYEQAMRERARLLKDDRRDAAWLSALEDAMATNGVAVAAARRDVVGRLRVAGAASRRGDDAFPAADLSIVGEVEQALSDGPALAAEDTVRTSLANSRRLDAITGGAATGPHRSDFVVRHADKDMPAGQCSTGEQKALLIGIVLANARLLAADRGMAPLLLLDEVAAHLDEGRRGALYEEILALGVQAWLTGTDRMLFGGLEGKARFYGVKDATVTDLA